MIRLVMFLAAACALASGAMAADTEVLHFDFEQEAVEAGPFTFRLGSGAELTAEAKYAGERSLKGTGTNAPRQYIGIFDDVKVKPGGVYGIHFRYKTSAAFPKDNLLVHVQAGKNEIIRYRSIRAAADGIWQNKWLQFRVPENAQTITVRLRFANVPESEFVYIDDFSITEVADPYAPFTMDFEKWAEAPYKNSCCGRAGASSSSPSAASSARIQGRSAWCWRA